MYVRVLEKITLQCRLPAFVRLLHSKLTFEAFEGSGKTRITFARLSISDCIVSRLASMAFILLRVTRECVT